MKSLMTRALFIFGVYLTLLLMSSVTLASVQVSGNVVISEDEHFLKLSETKEVRILIAGTSDVEAALNKLKHGDYVTGEGEISDKGIVLRNIEYVGLQRILGTWLSDKSSTMKFKDYTTLVIQSSSQMTPLKYAILPGAENVWKIYFTDDESIVLGTLNLTSKTSAQLTIYNGDEDGSASELNLHKLK